MCYETFRILFNELSLRFKEHIVGSVLLSVCVCVFVCFKCVLCVINLPMHKQNIQTNTQTKIRDINGNFNVNKHVILFYCN